MADPNLTPHYNFNQPLVGGDDNVWGGYLNDNWGSIDSILWDISGVANAALTQAAGDARYLQLTGGSLGPNSLIVNGPSQFNNYVEFTGASTVAIKVQANFTGGATFGTAQVFFNSQVTFSADALVVTPAAADNSQRAASTAWVRGAIAALPAIPAPSSTVPAMDGTGAVGVGTTYARADHVHPSDTSRLALAGGTMLGPITLNADPVVALGAATKQYVDANFGHNSGFGGLINKIRNPGMDIWQRGSVSLPSTGGYSADGWLVGLPGASAGVTVVLGGQLVGGYSRNSLGIQGAAGVPTVNLQHRIESSVVAPLAGRVCTFQARIYNNTGSPLTPTLSNSIPNVADNFSANTPDGVTLTLQTIAAGATGVVSYTFAPDPTAIRGYLMGLGFGSALNAAGRTIYVSDVDFRITPGVIIGLQANPPPPELRPVGIEMAFCQRYYEVSGTTDIFSGDVTSGGTYYATSKFQGAKRAVPTVTIIASSNAGFPSGAPANAGAGTTGFRTSMVANGTAAGGYFQYNWNATAEL